MYHVYKGLKDLTSILCRNQPTGGHLKNTATRKKFLTVQALVVFYLEMKTTFCFPWQQGQKSTPT